jgi:drug/metabolite transporter (DMT)-like permease
MAAGAGLELKVFLVVLLAAVLHASWNALVKSGSDKRLSMTAVVLGHVPPAVVALMFVPTPDPACWLYLTGGVFMHTGYQLFLLRAYGFGDFTQVYPIARGTAPLLVAIISVAVLGVTLSSLQMLAIAIIGAGIASLCLARSGDGKRNAAAAGAALVTACFIAGYSLIDGYGARLSGSPVGFYSWLSIINAALIAAYMRVTNPGLLSRVARDGKAIAWGGGGASYLAYALVVWAFTQAPIALVTALRETSIVFALLIGVVVLKEGLSFVKVISTFASVSGAALLKFAR